MAVSAYIGVGSNLGDSQRLVGEALQGLAGLPQTTLAGHSSLYRTDPVGVTDQPPFINAVAHLETGLAARSLLKALLALEARAGRVREQPWGPRTLDLDLLVFGNQELWFPELVVPHPELHRRAFVLYPLAEIAPNLEIPGLGPVTALCRQIPAEGIERLGAAGA